MEPLLSREQIRRADQHATSSVGIPESVLMEHAALAVVKRLEERFTSLLPTTRGVITAGPGNNGGDALAVARLLWEKGIRSIEVTLFATPEKLSGSAALQYKILRQLGIPLRHQLTSEMLKNCDWVIDGMLGTGLGKPLQGDFLRAVETINLFSDQKWVIAIDLPSGLNADTGNPLGNCVRASETVALGFLKKGLVTGLAANFVGQLRLATIQIPRTIPELHWDIFRFEASDAKLPPRPPVSHKGTFGHVYVWAGTAEKQGACAMTSLSALRSGTGLATLIGDAADIEAIRPRLPQEIMSATAAADIFENTPTATLAIGPGLGESEAKWQLVKSALASNWKLIVDADALTLMAKHREEAKQLMARRDPQSTILTPHPKEAARLLLRTVEELQQDRYATLSSLCEQWNASVILKGKGSLMKSPGGPILVVTEGDTGLAKGGSGDVLTGVLAALVAQGMPAADAMPLACYLEGRASELLSARIGSERASLASEVTEQIPHVFKEIEEAACASNL